MMAFDVINIGTTANDGTGDPLRTAFEKTNDNFALAVEGATGATDGNLVVFDGASGKLVKDTGISFSSLAAGLTFQGTWNANTNSPTLTSSVGTNGHYYIVGTAGNTTLNGLTSWLVGDNVIFTSGVWTRYRPPAQVLAGDGTAAAPSISFAADTDVGLFRPAANTLACSTNGAERLRFTSAGVVQLPSGSLGVKFGTRNANLADYEEGTWTPVYEPATGSFANASFGRQIGDYVKIGRLVTVWFRIRTEVAFDPTGGSGNLVIGGLPFTARSGSFRIEGAPFSIYGGAISHGEFWATTFNTNNVSMFINADNKIQFVINQPFFNSSATFLTVADMATGAVRNYLGGSFTYSV